METTEENDEPQAVRKNQGESGFSTLSFNNKNRIPPKGIHWNSRFSMRFSTIDEWKVENFENTRWLTVKNFQSVVVFPQWIQEFPQMNRILERKKVHFLKNYPENV